MNPGPPDRMATVGECLAVAEAERWRHGLALRLETWLTWRAVCDVAAGAGEDEQEIGIIRMGDL